MVLGRVGKVVRARGRGKERAKVKGKGRKVSGTVRNLLLCRRLAGPLKPIGSARFAALSTMHRVLSAFRAVQLVDTNVNS